MLIISCPYCGPRDEIEFVCGGEAHIARPLANNTITDAEFAEYLFIRDNPKGVFLERWHSLFWKKSSFGISCVQLSFKNILLPPAYSILLCNPLSFQ